MQTASDKRLTKLQRVLNQESPAETVLIDSHNELGVGTQRWKSLGEGEVLDSFNMVETLDDDRQIVGMRTNTLNRAN